MQGTATTSRLVTISRHRHFVTPGIVTLIRSDNVGKITLSKSIAYRIHLIDGKLWHSNCLRVGQGDEGLNTLRITFQDTDEAIEMRLEGRVAGPWASELDRVWVETAPRLSTKKLIIDLHNVTYADANGKQVLRTIYAQTRAEFVTNTPWAQFLAEEVTAGNAVKVEEGD